MYIGTPSVIRLAAFVHGYDYAAERLGGGGPDPFLSEFRDWIHARFRSTQHSWEDTIRLHSADEAEAFKRFWELLDTFLQERVNGAKTTDRAVRGRTGR
jgi:hypothetical protein